MQFDDTRIVSGSWDKTIKVIVEKGSPPKILACHLSFPQVWNRRTNTAWAALTLAGHSGTVRCLHLHGNRLVSGSSDRTIKVNYCLNEIFIVKKQMPSLVFPFCV